MTIIVSTIKLRKPKKLGVAVDSWLRHDGRAVACSAATCLYLLRTFLLEFSIVGTVTGAWTFSVSVATIVETSVAMMTDVG